MKLVLLLSLLFLSLSTEASNSEALNSKSINDSKEVLIKLREDFKSNFAHKISNQSLFSRVEIVEDLNLNNWILVRVPAEKYKEVKTELMGVDGVSAVQPNFKLRLFDNPSLTKIKSATSAQKYDEFAIQNVKDNPPIPKEAKTGNGADPLFNKQWGMNDIGVKEAWQQSKGNSDIIVAVIDTGVDYTHEDLVPNLWRNVNEIPDNNIDDDKNGYVDDIIGWDFPDNDNKPFDMPGDLLQGGNPGHGTHCAGNVAARGDNGMGIAGVAPNVKIMVLKFISTEGSGTTADAIKAIKYAVDNGALITSNSWGSIGEDPNDKEGNQALRDAITYSEEKGRLFVAAAGNGKNGKGYNNDTDSEPAYPASYSHDSIISVAAINSQNNLGGFSNWGVKTVDIAAPGVKVFSTTVGNKYSDSVIPFLATWDGTSMATPHVAGAAALYWSKHPNADFRQVKAAILSSAAKISNLNQKLVSGGKLDVKALMKQ